MMWFLELVLKAQDSPDNLGHLQACSKYFVVSISQITAGTIDEHKTVILHDFLKALH